MFHCAVFTLADQRRSGQYNRQHGNVVDDRHHPAKPRGIEVRVKAHPGFQRYQRFAVITVARDKAVHFTVDNILDIPIAGKCLAHARGIDVHLNIWLASGEDITLKIRRNIYRKGITPGVQSGIHLIGGDHLRWQKPRAIEAVNDPVR